MEEIVIVAQACCVVWLAMQYKKQVVMNDRMSDIAADMLYFLSRKGLIKEYGKWLTEERYGHVKELLSKSEGCHGNHEVQ